MVPGGSGRAGEVLAQGGLEPAPDRPGRLPRGRRGTALVLAVLVLGLGGASALIERPDPPPAPEQQAPDLFPGVQASSQLLSEDRLRVRLLVEVRIASQPAATGLPGSGFSAVQVRLQGISAPGLVVRATGRPLPLLLGYVGRFGSGLEQVVRLTVDVVALGCAEPARPRRLALALSRYTVDGEVEGVVQVRDRAEVVQALEDLVQRSCGPGR